MKVTDENIMIRTREGKPKRRALGEIRNKTFVSAVERAEEKLSRDLRYVPEYAESILAWYKQEEGQYQPASDYMKFQSELRWAMRTVLVDWIIDVHHKLDLLPETLYLSVNLIDRFLSVRVVSIGKLQLVGVSGLLVASKFQEVASPSVETFVVLTDRSFTESEILRAEKYMLHCLEYKIGYPSPLNWIRRCAQDGEVEKVSGIILDLLLLEEQFLQYTSSMLGCACSYVACGLVKEDEYEVFSHYSPYGVADLSECVERVKVHLSKPIVHTSIFKKHGASFTKHLGNLHRVHTRHSA
ncbi:G2/mitotic-specific cyclin 2 [Nematocida sp. AWRm77]|nr:G2/mitotic-specific cyclin 2 [Nematocida sp. AWRm77]